GGGGLEFTSVDLLRYTRSRLVVVLLAPPYISPHPYNAFIGLRFTRFNLTRLKIYFKRKSLHSLAPKSLKFILKPYIALATKSALYITHTRKPILQR
ncbi:hypothetical protein, partial [Helicobacter cinaedi]|uniref:hypothetical protein n=1 Tax=Helicobacter cinaedi TaxID=213 RepID=UPI0014023643